MRIQLIIAFSFTIVLTTMAVESAAQRITLKGKDMPLLHALAKISEQTGFSFALPHELEKSQGAVTLDVTDAPLETVLTDLFSAKGLDYEINETTKTIYISAKSAGKRGGAGAALGSNRVQAYPEVTGRVTDSLGTPLEGASVVVLSADGKRTTVQTTTDRNGMFRLKNVPDGGQVQISFIGYAATSLVVQANMGTIVLKKSDSPLDEVQVIAYGTTSRRLSTGNVSTVKAEDIAKQPVSNPLLALQGRVAGMEITQNTGLPGSGITVRIRGNNSITNGNDPLYIVDGVPYTSQLLPNLGKILGNSGGTLGSGAGNPFSYINPADIESIDVLKDADATAIYGSRAANGAVLITTKRGKAGKTGVNVNMYTGWGNVNNKLELLSRRQYLDMRYEALKNDGIALTPTTPGAFDLTQWDTTRSTDWQKELIGGTARYSHVQASVSGGNTLTQYLISGTRHKETTVFPGNLADQKGAVHFNVTSTSSNQKLHILLSGNYQVDDNQLIAQDYTTNAIRLSPVAPPVYNTDGSLNWANSTWENPLAPAELKYKSRTNNLISNATVAYQLLHNLEIKSSFGYTSLQTDETSIIPLSYWDPAYWSIVQRKTSFADNSIRSWIVEPQITWSVNLGGGQLTALAGATIQQKASKGQILEAEGFNSDHVMENIKSAPRVSVGSTVDAVYKYNALFSRLNYNWQSKYLLNLTARRDGSSRFGPESRFHNFGAIGAAWIFSNEQFVQQVLPVLSYGKLRASYGTTGSDQVGDYRFMDLYGSTNAGNAYQGANGLVINNLFNSTLAWEETKKMEAGLELAFLKDRLFFNASYYRHRSSNQLTGYKLPSITGFTSISANQNATVQNTGWEFVINTTNLSLKNIRWTSSLNLTINRNKLVSIDSRLSSMNLKFVGQPLNSTFVYHYLGVDPATGEYQVADSHGSPTLTPNPLTDATVLVDLNPRFYGGFQNSISYCKSSAKSGHGELKTKRGFPLNC